MLVNLRKLASLMLIGSIIAGCQKDPETVFNQDAPSVEAGTSQTIQMPANSFTLNGSATTQNGVIKAYLWSLVSGPNVPVITSPGSKTTTVTGFISGNYLFQLMATDDAGLTGVDTTSVLVKPSPIQTLTLQPINNTSEIHILGNNSGINNGDPNSPDFVCAAWTMGGSNISSRSIVKFDLSSIPSNASILTAKLTLYSNPTPLMGDLINANSGSNNAMYIQRVTSSWVPSSTVWLNQPSTTTSDQVLIPHTSQSMLDLPDIDVKNLISGMLGNNNFGLLIKLQNEIAYNIRDFCSSKYSNSAKRPTLIITYQ